MMRWSPRAQGPGGLSNYWSTLSVLSARCRWGSPGVPLHEVDTLLV
jgi:hypothetical protein